MIEITSLDTPPSLARTAPSSRPALRVGVVQHRWHPDAAALHAELDEGIGRAARLGADVVFLPELTLSRYPADTLPENDTTRGRSPRPRPSDIAEDLFTGPTFGFAADAARRHGICVHASLYQKAESPDGSDDGLGLNTAILVSPEGELLARTHKLHIPVTAGYYEDKFFRQGPDGDDAYEVHSPPSSAGHGWACPPAGMNGSPSWRGFTPSAGQNSWSTPPPSAPSRTTRTLTPSRCGSRSLWATALPTGCSWWSPTAGAAKAR
jgi:N-carbamoylputrescine amidase